MALRVLSRLIFREVKIIYVKLVHKKNPHFDIIAGVGTKMFVICLCVLHVCTKG